MSCGTRLGVIPSFFPWLGPWKGGIMVSDLGNQNDGLGVQSKGWEDCVCSEKSWPDLESIIILVFILCCFVYLFLLE